ncbi:MAG: RHS repeat-associated core domain-containing protein, partial [Leptospiraceae bacterium]|nr:RHS repeat-associated core domain-containing protein [Leptospiraceae bacterium]
EKANEINKNLQNQKIFADVNGDGLSDFVRYINGKVYITYSNGYNYSDKEYHLAIQAKALSNVLDANGDGLADFYGYYVSLDNDLKYNQNGDSSVLKAYNLRMPNRLYAINGGYNQKTTIANRFIGDFPNSFRLDLPKSYSDMPSLAPNYVVYILGNTQSVEYYSYQNPRFKQGSPEEKKSLGFQSIEKSFYLGNDAVNKETRTFSQDSTLAGSLLKKETYVYNDSKVYELNSITEHSYETANVNSVSYTRNTTSTSKSYDDLGNIQLTETETVTYDTSGNVTKNEKTKSPGNFITTFEFSNFDSKGRYGTLIQKANGSVIENMVYTYTGNNLTQMKNLIKSGVWVTSIMQYDTYGNLTSIKDGKGIETKIEYDAVVHKFPITTTRGKMVITTTYDDVTGNLLTETSKEGGGTIVKTYDDYGRLSTVKYPGEAEWHEKYIYVDTASERSTQMIKNDGTTDGLWTKEFRDIYGHVTKKISKAGGGITISEDMEYDSKGRLSKKSKPYFTNETPKYATYTYDYLNRPTKIEIDGGMTKTISYDGFSATTTDPTGTHTVTQDTKGRVVSRNDNGLTTKYGYSSNGNITITDSGGDVTTVKYDLVGNKVSQKDPNTGTTTYTYDKNGNLTSYTDSRGITITYTYDDLDRLTKVTRPNGEPATEYKYDENDQTGKLTKVIDGSGTTEFYYDKFGRMVAKKKSIDDYNFIFRYGYDILNRINKITYPNGVAINKIYSESGHPYKMTMDSADGENTDNDVVTYSVNSGQELERLTGNNVKTIVSFDAVNQKPLTLKTNLASGDLVQHWNYKYDTAGNISQINDTTYSSDPWANISSQEFTFDVHGRLTSSKGKYGVDKQIKTLSYSYDKKGNMLTKGDFTYKYNNTDHPHAVTSVDSTTTGTIVYDYDAAGNMTQRDEDKFYYNSEGKLSQIVKENGETDNYLYNDKGIRVKKRLERGTSITEVYTIDDLYEVYRSPGIPERHTLYVKGMDGDLVAQLTSENPVLITEPIQKVAMLQPVSFYISKGRIELTKLIQNVLRDNPYQIKIYLLYGTGFVILAYSIFMIVTLNIFRERIFRVAWMTTAQVVIVAFSFGCMPQALIGTKSNQTPFWLLGSFVTGGGITSDTPSVADPLGTPSPSTVYAGTPTVGMHFIHPDHLGSVSMLTDGNGRMVAGVDINSGRSYVTYTPYGEVNRTNSSGPDIFRHKYSGQEEDSESGLYYYKSRYYDPMLGRFIQADNQSDPNTAMGMNPYMYTNGNPVNFRDPSGHARYDLMFSNIVKNMSGGFSVNKVGNAVKWGVKGATGALKWASKGLERAAKTVNQFIFGKHHNQNSLSHQISRSSIGKWGGQQLSDAGVWLDRQIIEPLSKLSLKQILIGIAVIVAAVIIGWALLALVKIAVVATASYFLSGVFLHTSILFGATTWGGLITIASTSMIGMLVTGPFMKTFGRELGRVLDGKEGAALGENAGATGNTIAGALDFASEGFVGFMGEQTGLGKYYVSGNPFPELGGGGGPIITPAEGLDKWEKEWANALKRKPLPLPCCSCRCR